MFPPDLRKKGAIYTFYVDKVKILTLEYMIDSKLSLTIVILKAAFRDTIISFPCFSLGGCTLP